MTNCLNDQNQFVRLKDVSKSFVAGEHTICVLDGVSLQIAKGESIALRGRSGSGKSTLLNIVAGIDAADSGDVFVGDQHIGQLDETARTLFRRKHIGFVYQSFNLLSGLSVADNIGLVLELNGWSHKERTARVAQLLRAVDMTALADRFPDVLSGGEQQRIAVARAVAHKPQLILADEPTGNLDDRNADAVLPLLLDLVADNQASLIMATHSHGIAASCNRQVVVSRGKLA